MPKWTIAAAALIGALSTNAVSAATAEKPAAEAPQTGSAAADKAKAAENRKKPLQRCDQLADKAQQECLEKARQRIVEARKTREGAAKGGAGAQPQTAGKVSGGKDAPTK